MKKITLILLSLALLTGCRGKGISCYWDNHSIDYSDISAAQEQFADYAELASAAPEKEALASLDNLFDKLLKDEVAYYIYTQWIDGAFYNILSPCRNEALYFKAVERMVKDGVLTPSDCESYLQRREWFQYNLKGQAATVPGAVINERTLVLLLDTSCPSCREALTSLASKPEFTNLKKIAICCGYGSVPNVAGWDYLKPDNFESVFDIKMTPVYFVVAPDGVVEQTYALAL